MNNIFQNLNTDNKKIYIPYALEYFVYFLILITYFNSFQILYLHYFIQALRIRIYSNCATSLIGQIVF